MLRKHLQTCTNMLRLQIEAVCFTIIQAMSEWIQFSGECSRISDHGIENYDCMYRTHIYFVMEPHGFCKHLSIYTFALFSVKQQICLSYWCSHKDPWWKQSVGNCSTTWGHNMLYMYIMCLFMGGMTQYRRIFVLLTL